MVWCCDEAPGFTPTRPQDRAFVGNIVQAMVAYASGALGEQAVPFAACDRIIAIGSDRMMAAVGAARHTVLAPHLKPGHRAIASINSPMQCMMKEICAQCLQPHRDPESGKITYVFSCFNQDQPIDRVDFRGLAARLGAEHGAGEADGAVDRALPAARRVARRRLDPALAQSELLPKKNGDPCGPPFLIARSSIDYWIFFESTLMSWASSAPLLLSVVTTMTPSAGVNAHSAELIWMTLDASVAPGATAAKPPVLIALSRR